eukprot:CAMPEP_0174331666 /NCGR_PEP_ID=MMETSP0810-20121108/17671_1 /TAXON_ID=73025 ORGANISM="Eutreptiella gymnastica-like, Strain CCMP1594" /NCGR_SAMPLE_ID=MMETSP0810 /ASSEMBLY_ACC=CAM_ASM_000659 /LENGTH=104 /DNA_ID=CAMNT_0015447593 /DNA_START=19 /DNA_END=331 /DNA_ORIENTATION=-
MLGSTSILKVLAHSDNICPMCWTKRCASSSYSLHTWTSLTESPLRSGTCLVTTPCQRRLTGGEAAPQDCRDAPCAEQRGNAEDDQAAGPLGCAPATGAARVVVR